MGKQGKLIDETGNVYGYLTVIERGPNNKDNRATWKCRCKCGNEINVLGKSLRNGNTKSCGCLQKEKTAQANMDRVGSLVGQTFGKLTVISEEGFITGANKKRRRVYNCLCECGNYCLVQHQYLAYGDTTSCGCIRSKGENLIEQLLIKNNINYKKEYTFTDLFDILPLRFDFAIFNEQERLIGLIEFQGEQHFDKNNGFYNEDIVRHDKMKEEYCKKHNIPLNYLYYKKPLIITLEDLHLERFKGDDSIDK